MLELQELEPTCADVQYEIAESYRLDGECSKALFYYNESLKIDNDFAPGYLGLARAPGAEPGANVLPLLELAQQADWATVTSTSSGPTSTSAAMISTARCPTCSKPSGSCRTPPAGAARVCACLLATGQLSALAASRAPTRTQRGRRAYKIDRTLLPAYLYLGRGYIETGVYENAESRR